MSEEHKAVLEKYFYTVDVDMDSSKFADLFTEDGHFSIWHFPVSVGKEQIKGGCQAMFDMVANLKHSSTRVLSIDQGKYNVLFCIVYCRPALSFMLFLRQIRGRRFCYIYIKRRKSPRSYSTLFYI